MSVDIETAVERLKMGLPPGNRQILQEITVGQEFLPAFWQEKYLKNYLSRGGSKIKFITGRTGSGRTHFLDLVLLKAQELGYIPVYLSAKDVWLYDFKEIYVAILRQVNLLESLRAASSLVISRLGYDPRTVPPELTFTDYLSSRNELDPLTKREIRQELTRLFLANPLIDNNFAIACSLLTGGFLGHPILEEASRNLLLNWLEGSREAKLASVRRLGLSPSKITKYNARHMLRSLVEVCRLAGYKGLVVALDELEVLVGGDKFGSMRYTRLKRDDAYECIRELIDEIDTLHNLMFIFSFERKLMDEEMTGLKSYEALWMRIQNEVAGSRFNCFADIVDLDRLVDEVYTPECMVELSNRLARVADRIGQTVKPISLDAAEELHARARFGKVALPRRVVLSTLHNDGA